MSCLHRYPFSAINFYCYKMALDLLNERERLLGDDKDSGIGIGISSDDDSDEGSSGLVVLMTSHLLMSAVAGTIACMAYSL